MKRLARVQLLVLDDFALERCSSEETYCLFELVDARERRGIAALVASPNAVNEWDDYIDDASARAALFGRLLSRGQAIELNLVPQKTANRPPVAHSRPRT